MANFDQKIKLGQKAHFFKNKKHIIMPFQLPELLVIGFLFILFFGRDKLGPTFRQLGGAINEFKKGISETEEINKEITESISFEPKKVVQVSPIEKLQPVAE